MATYRDGNAKSSLSPLQLPYRLSTYRAVRSCPASSKRANKRCILFLCSTFSSLSRYPGSAFSFCKAFRACERAFLVTGAPQLKQHLALGRRCFVQATRSKAGLADTDLSGSGGRRQRRRRQLAHMRVYLTFVYIQGVRDCPHLCTYQRPGGDTGCIYSLPQ